MEVNLIAINHQLVLVEGLTGLGKSTLAHFIARQFQYNGIDASWIHEGEDPHPVGVDFETNITDFMNRSLQRWQSFIGQVQDTSTIFVIEAAFFNNLFETLYAHCLDQAAILDFALKHQEVIKPVKPALVYLVHPDIEAALEENFRNRGTGFRDFVIRLTSSAPIARQNGWADYDGMLQFWRGFVEITDSLFQVYDIDRLAIDVSAGAWVEYHRMVTNFLGITLVDDPRIGSLAADKFVGDYLYEDGKNCRICYKDGYLVTDVFMNVETKLIPKVDGGFLVEKWHFELLFEFDRATGEVVSFTIGGWDVDYLKAVGLKAEKIKAY